MAIDVVVEEVAQNLEEAAAVTRKLNTSGMGYLFGGLVVGAAVGFYIGHRWKKARLRAEAFEASALEVDEIRAFYAQKAIAAEPKADLEQIIEERGYSRKEDEGVIRARPLPAPVPVMEAPTFMGTIRGDLPEEEILAEESSPDRVRVVYGPWNYAEEQEKRTPNAPYVIHLDEFNDPEIEYDHVNYTYYARDDVLVDDADDRPITHPDQVVGQDNLKFGHGTDDPDMVFVRNDTLGLEMEICRINASYEQEVLGHQPDGSA